MITMILTMLLACGEKDEDTAVEVEETVEDTGTEDTAVEETEESEDTGTEETEESTEEE